MQEPIPERFAGLHMGECGVLAPVHVHSHSVDGVGV